MTVATMRPPRQRYRWSNHDHYWGPFTYAREPKYRSLAIVLCSGDDEDRPCRLRIQGFGHTLITALPSIIKPHRRKVVARTWDADTVARVGRNWYYEFSPREYGVSVYDGHLSIYLGRQTHDSSTEQRWSCFLPWTQWRFVRHSMYGLDGELFWTEPKHKKGQKRDWDATHRAGERCPSRSFAFKDFDGQELTVRARIEEREWLFGEGWFKWLSLFRRPMIRRSLDLWFSDETGPRKGSWKGGTIGSGIDMLPGELHEAAFRRYCAKEGMTFIGLDPEPMAVAA